MLGLLTLIEKGAIYYNTEMKWWGDTTTRTVPKYNRNIVETKQSHGCVVYFSTLMESLRIVYI